MAHAASHLYAREVSWPCAHTLVLSMHIMIRTLSRPRALLFAGVLLFSGVTFVVSANGFLSSTVEEAEATDRVDVWWPLSGATLSGVQPLKGRIEGRPVESYKMYWRVGDGQKHELPNNYETTPHKEYAIDFSGWTWRGAGPYEIIVSAEDEGGKLLGESRVSFTVGTGAPVQAVQAPTPVLSDTATPKEAVVRESSDTRSALRATTLQPARTESQTAFVQSAPSAAPLVGGLYVAATSNASKQAAQWRTSDPQKAALMDILAKGAQTVWLGGWNSDVKADVQKVVAAAGQQGTTPSFAVYNIPHRDCGGYSAGGTASADQYRSWIRSIAEGLGKSRAIVVLEPDALTGASCLPESGKNERFQLLAEAVETLSASGNVSVYIDAGHARWLSAPEAAALLEKVNIRKAAGFALNVSNFIGNDESIEYGTKIANALSSKIGKTPHFVIDTSRNGQGAGDTWCNPQGRGLGMLPTVSTGKNLVDAYLWVKAPGESDGNCNGAPNAGVWWPEYALGLIERRAH